MEDIILLFMLKYLSLLTLIILSHEAGHIIACKIFGVNAHLEYKTGQGFSVWGEELPRNKHAIVLFSGIILGIIPLISAYLVYTQTIMDWVLITGLSILYLTVWIRFDLKMMGGAKWKESDLSS